MRPKELKELLKTQVSAGSNKDTELGSIFIWGPPGVGKSAVITEVAEEMNIGCIDFRLVLCDPTDLRGIPVPVTDENGKQTAMWIPPEELPKEGRGILLFDDFVTAPPLVQAGAYQIAIPPHQLGPYQLPPGWVIVGAGNTLKDRSLAHRMPKALSNRFTHIYYELNLDDWFDWALTPKAHIHPDIVAYLKWQPDALWDFNPESTDDAFATPRTWEKVSRAMEKIHNKSILTQAIAGNVGEGIAAKFAAFLKAKNELPPLETIFAGSNFVPDRIDLKYAMVSGLALRAKEDGPAGQFNRLLEYSENLPEEFSVLLVKMLVSRNRDLVAKSKLWQTWVRNHHEVIIG